MSYSDLTHKLTFIRDLDNGFAAMTLHFEDDFGKGFFSDFLQFRQDSSLEENLGLATFELRVDKSSLQQHLLSGLYVVFDIGRFVRCHDGVSGVWWIRIMRRGWIWFRDRRKVEAASFMQYRR